MFPLNRCAEDLTAPKIFRWVSIDEWKYISVQVKLWVPDLKKGLDGSHTYDGCRPLTPLSV